MQCHGWFIIDKPLGLGSTQAVSAVKRALRQAGYAKTKVGHGGTLDPLATGVLPVAIGEATKLAGRMLDATKAYEFKIQFGTETDTLDAEGKIVATSEVLPTLSQIKAVLPEFTGPIEQVPPAFSALKIDGTPAYKRARSGESVQLATRSVVISSLGVLVPSCEQNHLPRSHQDTKKVDCCGFAAEVSKGTYIRSLARDIARVLGTVGHVTSLRRTRAGPFGLDQAISLDILDDAAKGAGLEALLRPIEAGLDGIPALALTPEQAAALRQGRVLLGQAATDGLYLAKAGDVPVALVKAEVGAIRVERGINL